MNASRFVKEKSKGKLETMIPKIGETQQTGVSEMKFYGPRQAGDGVIFSVFFPQAKSVQLAGDFNNWQPAKNPMQRIGDGIWQLRLSLAKGVYKYRLVVDGVWQQDPNNRMTEPNPYGGLNSVVKVS
jgi:1,4-alpha-glucan branching enzyme